MRGESAFGRRQRCGQRAGSGLLPLEHLGYCRPEITLVGREFQAEGSRPPDRYLSSWTNGVDAGDLPFKSRPRPDARAGCS